MRKPRTLLTALLTVFLAPAAHAAVVTSVFGGRVPCHLVSVGVGQICEGGMADRVETWDGVPLDVTVSIPPPEMDGPFPLIVDLHGFAAGKTPDPEIQELVPQGYVVLIYSARGQHFSCGFPESRQTDPTLADPDACTHRGWFRLADARYEVRDTQYLAGRLLDEGGQTATGSVPLVQPAIGVTGISFGGGQTNMLAALKDRMMMPDGTLVPWTSPNGTPMRVAAAGSLIGWSDLAYALVPNGRTLDYRALNPYFEPGVSERGGVMKKSWVDALYDAGVPTAFYSDPGVDPDADIQTWYAHLNAGEPYEADPVLHHAIEELTSHHSAYYFDDSEEPAPLFIYDGSTDDIMPFDEALRFYRKTKSLYPTAEISLEIEDGFAHPRGSLASSMRSQPYAAITQLFNWHLKGTGSPLPWGVRAWTQACASSTQVGPLTAADWDAIHPGEVRHADATPRSFDSTPPGNSTNAMADDPIMGGATSCRTVSSADDDPAAATYRLPAACTTYTLLGSPTVIADLAVTGDIGAAEIAARLWDVAPDNSMALVTHGLYRPRTDNLGPQVFQLHPTGWQFMTGHVPKLELLGQSAPYGRPSNGTFSITASNLELRLPVNEAPGGCVVQSPAAPVLPPSAPEPTPTTTTLPGATTTTTSQVGTTTTTTLPTAANQTVLGRSFQVKNPGSSAQRKVAGRALERHSNDTIVGNPVANGASLEVITHGGTSSDQTFSLPKQGWRAIGAFGFRYAGPTGGVRKASIKKAPSGVFQIKVLVLGKDGPVNVVPPNPGIDGGFVLTLTGGGSYCVGFGGAAGGTTLKDDSRQWSVRNPTAEACPATVASTTTTVPQGTTTTQPGATTTTTLPLAECGVYPQCDGTCAAGTVCSVVLGGSAGCVCVPGGEACSAVSMACSAGACPVKYQCLGNPDAAPGGCGCVQTQP